MAFSRAKAEESASKYRKTASTYTPSSNKGAADSSIPTASGFSRDAAEFSKYDNGMAGIGSYTYGAMAVQNQQAEQRNRIDDWDRRVSGYYSRVFNAGKQLNWKTATTTGARGILAQYRDEEEGLRKEADEIRQLLGSSNSGLTNEQKQRLQERLDLFDRQKSGSAADELLSMVDQYGRYGSQEEYDKAYSSYRYSQMTPDELRKIVNDQSLPEDQRKEARDYLYGNRQYHESLSTDDLRGVAGDVSGRLDEAKAEYNRLAQRRQELQNTYVPDTGGMGSTREEFENYRKRTARDSELKEIEARMQELKVSIEEDQGVSDVLGSRVRLSERNDQVQSYEPLRNDPEFAAKAQRGRLTVNPSADSFKAGAVQTEDGTDAPEIPNKLEFYLHNKDRERNVEESESLYNALAMGDRNGWAYIEEPEREMYNYLLAEKGAEAADQYLEDLQITLSRRQATDINTQTAQRYDQSGWFGRAAMNAASVPANVFGGIESAAGDVIGTVTGEYNPYSAWHRGVDYAGTVRGKTTENIGDTWGNGTWAQFLQNGYQALMSGADSALGAYTFGKGYTAIMGASAASQRAKELYENGADEKQILTGAIASGAIEMLTEKYSIEGFLDRFVENDIGGFKDFLKNTLMQSLGEASEEVASELSNMAVNAILLGANSDNQQEVRTLMEQEGLSREEAERKAMLNRAMDVFWAGYGGFVSGGGSMSTIGGAVQLAGATAQNYDLGREVQNSNAAEKLVETARGTEGFSKDRGMQKLARQVEAASKKQKRNGFQRGMDTLRAGKLYGKVLKTQSESVTAKEKAVFREAAAAELKKNGTEAPKLILDTLEKAAYGEELTESEAKMLDTVKGESIIEAVGNSEEFQKAAGEATKEGRQQLRQSIEMTQRRTAPTTVSDSNVNVTDDGRTLVTTEDGKTRETKVTGIDSMEGGKLTVKLQDGTTAGIDSISFGSSGEAMLYNVLANMDISKDTAQQILDTPFPNSEAMGSYAMGIQEMYRYGSIGVPMSSISNPVFSQGLSKAQAEYAYQLGKDAYTRANTKRIAEQAAKTKVRRGEGKVVIDEAIDQKNLTRTQKTSLKALKYVAHALGVNVEVFQSQQDAEGNYIGENGSYDTKTGTIRIDINAGSKGDGVMLFTAAHELTHFMRDWSADRYQTFSEFLMESYGEKSVPVDMLVQRQIDKAKANGRTLSYDDAMEEVVADSCERMLADGDAMEQIAKLRSRDAGLYEKVKNFIVDLAKKVANLYRKLDADSPEAAYVKQMSDKMEQLRQLWVEGVVSAAENYEAAAIKSDDVSTDAIAGKSSGTPVANNFTSQIADESKTKQQWRTEEEAYPKMAASLSDGSMRPVTLLEGVTAEMVKGLQDGKNVPAFTGKQVREYAMKKGGYSRAEIEAVSSFMDRMSEVMKKAELKYRYVGLTDVKNAELNFNYDSDGNVTNVVLSAMVKNGDYPINFDLTSICKKRQIMSKLMDILSKRGSLDSNRLQLAAKDIHNINTILRNEGFETACLGCFVESKRYYIYNWAKSFCDKWNNAVLAANPNAEYFGYGAGDGKVADMTLADAYKIEKEIERYRKSAAGTRVDNAIAKLRQKAENGEKLRTKKLSNAELNRLWESSIPEAMKYKYADMKPSEFTLEDMILLTQNGIVAGSAVKNQQTVEAMVNSGEHYQKLLRPSDLMTAAGIQELEKLPGFHGALYGHYGSGTPKLIQGYTPYNSEIALLDDRKGSMDIAEYLYTIAGIRAQSFSDFQIQNIYDYLQMVGDMAARKLPAHSYSKEINFAKIFGLTGIKLNMSVMFDIDTSVDIAHAGLTKYNPKVHKGEYGRIVFEDEQGKWVYDIGDKVMQQAYLKAYPDRDLRFVQSINFDEAIALEMTEGYSKNIGIIGVAYSSNHIIAMLNDNRVRYIIPYHRSGLPADVAKAIHIAKEIDYTTEQNNTKIKMKKVNGKMVQAIQDADGNYITWDIQEAFRRHNGDGKAAIAELYDHIRNDGWKVEFSKAQSGHGKYALYEKLQEIGDPRKTTDDYINSCVEQGVFPVFAEFAGHENYYKLVYDFNVYDCVSGEYAPQQAVSNTYPTMQGGEVVGADVADGEFDGTYLEGYIDDQMRYYDAYNQGLDEKLQDVATGLERKSGIKLSDRDSAGNEYSKYNLSKDKAPYDYSFLIRQEPMVPVLVPDLSAVKAGGKNISRGTVKQAGLRNASENGVMLLTKEGEIPFVRNVYTGKNLHVSGETIVHSLDGDRNRMYTNARIGYVAGEIIKNSIPINGLVDKANDVDGTYAMAGYAYGNDGREFIVITTVEQRKNAVVNLEVYDTAHSISGRNKKATEAATNARGSIPINGSTISISDFIYKVNDTYRSILSEDVLMALQEDRPLNGTYSDDTLYSLREKRIISHSETYYQKKIADLKTRIQMLNDEAEVMEGVAKYDKKQAIDALTKELTKQYHEAKAAMEAAHRQEIKDILQQWDEEAEAIRLSMQHDADEEIQRITKGYENKRKAAVENRKCTEIRGKIHKMQEKFHRMATAPAKADTLHAPVQMMSALASFCKIFEDSEQLALEKAAARVEYREAALEWLQDAKGVTKTRTSGLAALARQRERIAKKSATVAQLQQQYEQLANDTAGRMFHDDHVQEMLDDMAKLLRDNDIYDMSSDQLQRVYDTMRAMFTTIADANKLKRMGADKTLIGVATKLGKEINAVDVNHKAIAVAMRRFNMWQMSPDTFFDYICGWQKNNEGKAVQKMFADGTARMLGVNREFYEAFRHLTEAEDADTRKYVARMISSPMKDMVPWGLRDANGNVVETSRGMMLQAYLLLLQKDSYRSLVFGGFKLPDAKKYYNGNIDAAYSDADEGSLLSAGIATEYSELAREAKELREELKGYEADEADAKEMRDLQSIEGVDIESEKKRIEQRLKEIEAEVKTLVEGSQARLEEIRRQIEENMEETDHDIIKTAMDWYKHTGQLMTEVYENMYGYQPKLVDGYVPIHRDLTTVKIDIRDAKDAGKAFNLESSGFTKERVNSTAPILLTDIFEELNRQQNQVARYYGFAEVQHDFNRIWNTQVPGSRMTIKGRVAAKYGSGKTIFGVSGEEYINHYIASVAGGSKGDELLAGIYGNAAGATLSLNPRVAFSQLASIPTAAGVVGWGSMARGFARGAMTGFSKEAKRQLMNDSVWFYNRYKGAGGSTELSDLKTKGSMWQKAANSTWGKYLFNWCQAFDVYATSSMWAMAQDYVEHQGIQPGSENYQQAVEQTYADIIRKSQPNYTATERSDLLRDKRSGMRLLTMYKTQSNQNLNLLIAANGEFKRMKSDYANGRNGVTAEDVSAAGKKLANAYTSVIIGGTFAFVALRTIINMIMGNWKPYKDEEGDVTVGSVAGGMGKEMLSSIAGMFALGGQVYDAIYAVVSKEKYYGINDSAIGLIADLFDNGVKTLQSIVHADKDITWKQTMKTAKSLLALAGVPAGNFEKFVTAAEKWYAGFTEGKEAFMGIGETSGSTSESTADHDAFMKNLKQGKTDKCNDLVAKMISDADEVNDYEARKKLESGMKSYLRKRYIDGQYTEDEVRKAMEYIDMDKDDIDAAMNEWQGVKDTGRTLAETKDAYVDGKVTGADLIEYETKYLGKKKSDAEKDELAMRCQRDEGIVLEHLKGMVEDKEITADRAMQLELKYKPKPANKTEEEYADSVYWKVQGWTHGEEDWTRYSRLEDDITNGREIQAAGAELMEHGVKESTVKSHVKSYIREQFVEGEIDEKKARELLHKYLPDLDRTQDKVISEWNGDRETGKTASAIREDYLDKTMDSKEYTQYLMQYTGKSKEEAEKAERKLRCERDTGIQYDSIDDQIDMKRLDERKAISMYMTYGGLTEEAARKKVDAIVWHRDVPGSDKMSETVISKYYMFAERNGISKKDYYDFWMWHYLGDGKYRKKYETAGKIDAMNVSDATKKAYWECFRGSAKYPGYRWGY